MFFQMKDSAKINKMFSQDIVQGSATGLIYPVMMLEFPDGEYLLNIKRCKLLTSTDRVLPLISGLSIEKIFAMTYV
jgi:hypothetical protein